MSYITDSLERIENLFPLAHMIGWKYPDCGTMGKENLCAKFSPICKLGENNSCVTDYDKLNKERRLRMLFYLFSLMKGTKIIFDNYFGGSTLGKYNLIIRKKNEYYKKVSGEGIPTFIQEHGIENISKRVDKFLSLIKRENELRMKEIIINPEDEESLKLAREIILVEQEKGMLKEWIAEFMNSIALSHDFIVNSYSAIIKDTDLKTIFYLYNPVALPKFESKECAFLENKPGILKNVAEQWSTFVTNNGNKSFEKIKTSLEEKFSKNLSGKAKDLPWGLSLANKLHTVAIWKYADVYNEYMNYLKSKVSHLGTHFMYTSLSSIYVSDPPAGIDKCELENMENLPLKKNPDRSEILLEYIEEYRKFKINLLKIDKSSKDELKERLKIHMNYIYTQTVNKYADKCIMSRLKSYVERVAEGTIIPISHNTLSISKLKLNTGKWSSGGHTRIIIITKRQQVTSSGQKYDGIIEFIKPEIIRDPDYDLRLMFEFSKFFPNFFIPTFKGFNSFFQAWNEESIARDYFCQTWTLYAIINKLNNPEILISYVIECHLQKYKDNIWKYAKKHKIKLSDAQKQLERLSYIRKEYDTNKDVNLGEDLLLLIAPYEFELSSLVKWVAYDIAYNMPHINLK